MNQVAYENLMYIGQLVVFIFFALTMLALTQYQDKANSNFQFSKSDYWEHAKAFIIIDVILAAVNLLLFKEEINSLILLVVFLTSMTIYYFDVNGQNLTSTTPVAPVPAPAVSTAPKLCGFEVKIHKGAESTGRLDETGTDFARLFQTKYYVEVKTYPQLATLLEKLFDKATSSKYILSYDMRQLMLEVPRLEDPRSVYMAGHLVYFTVSSDRSIDQLVINSNGKKQYLPFGVNFVGDRKAHSNSDRIFKPSYLVDVTKFVEVYGLDA